MLGHLTKESLRDIGQFMKWMVQHEEEIGSPASDPYTPNKRNQLTTLTNLRFDN